MSTFAERLRKAREAAGFKSQAALAQAAGVSPGAIGNWEAGTRRQPRDIIALATALKVSPYWLSGQVKDQATATNRAPELQLNRALAHPMSQADYQTAPSTSWEQLMNEDPKGTFYVEIPDDSMSPRVRRGYECLFRTDVTARPGAGILVRDAENALYFREYREAADGAWEAFATNHAYRSLHSARDQLRIIAVLKAVMRGWEEM